MRPGFLGAAFRRLPPVARRDQHIAELKKQVSALRKQPDPPQPSFHEHLHRIRRLRDHGAPARSITRHGKFWVYDWMQTHGIDIPRQLGRWGDPHDILWDDLPDLVVVKRNRGSTERGVLPLRRQPGGWQVIGRSDEVRTGDQLADSLADRIRTGRIEGPFGAEEFLDEDGTGARPPMDVKVYAFYGEAAMILLRRTAEFGNPHRNRRRFIDLHGDDVVSPQENPSIDPSLEPPGDLGAVIETAKRISLAVRVPFSRIDLYVVGDRVVFGEVTPAPGADFRRRPPRAIDQMLGEAWERAEARLAADIAGGMSPEPEPGPVRPGGRQE